MSSDAESLQGTWNIDSLEVEGRKMNRDLFSGAQIIIDGDLFATRGMGAPYKGTFVVNDASVPKSFDVLFNEGPHSGSSSLGIYELDGDQWKLCLGFAGMSRPRDFVTLPGSGHALETLTRG
jgi:uncharacterized protein (TIGR03067 family)